MSLFSYIYTCTLCLAPEFPNIVIYVANFSCQKINLYGSQDVFMMKIFKFF